MAKVGRIVKEAMVEELTGAFETSQCFFVASMGALSASESDTLRKKLRGQKARMLMIKRSLGLQGLAELKLGPGLGQADGAADLFQGSIALVFPGEDIIPAAKLLADFAKENKDKLTIRGALVEGQLLDGPRFTELANLPPKPQLIANLIGVLESPISSVVWTLESVLGEVAWLLEEVAKTKPPQKGA